VLGDLLGRIERTVEVLDQEEESKEAEEFLQLIMQRWSKMH